VKSNPLSAGFLKSSHKSPYQGLGRSILRSSLAAIPSLEMNYLSTTEAAEILGFHRVSVSSSIRHGLLKATRFGKMWLIKAEDIRTFILNHSHQSRVAHVDLREINRLAVTK
jgi:excisionase family DNA binding protein